MIASILGVGRVVIAVKVVVVVVVVCLCVRACVPAHAPASARVFANRDDYDGEGDSAGTD